MALLGRGDGRLFASDRGLGMSRSLGGKLAADALEMAIQQRRVPDIVHSDRGSTYATSIYRELSHRHQMRQSTSSSRK